MAETRVGKLIQKYESNSGSYRKLELHLNELAAIGQEFVVPNNISPEDLEKLAKSLGNLLKLLKKEDADKKVIDTIKTISSEISSISTKKISQRTSKNNRYLLDLSDILVDLKTQLSTFIATGVIISMIEHFQGNLLG